MERIWGQFNDNTAVLLTLFVILMSGFLITRLTNVLRMPRVSGYIIAGIVIGPCVLHLVPGGIVDRMGFVSDIALAFIAFGVGKFFKKDALRRTGREIVWITVSEALAAGALVTLVLHFLFGLSWDFSLILGAIATATAPASTMMTIGQYKARGEMVRMLLQIVALDDVVCLLTFSVVSAWVSGRADGALSVASVVLPIVWNLAAIAMGAGCGVILSRLLTPQRSRDNRLILVIAMLCGLSGLCAAVDISPLLSCMVFGAVYINLTKDKKLYRQISHFTPPVMSIFFIVSGMNLDLTSFRAGRHRRGVFLCADRRKIPWDVCELPSGGKKSGNLPVHGTCAGAAGRRRHRPCFPWKAASSAGGRRACADGYFVVFRAL